MGPGDIRERHSPVELSIVMPCLNEAETLGACIAAGRDALAAHRISGEIVVADNGSTDGSREVATRLGARLVDVERRGYGNALMMGIAAARGRYVLIGDSDGSYNFRELLPFVEKLRAGVDLVQGCRLGRGGGKVHAGAMPKLHRWVGNPLLSWIARRFFQAPINDVYCGLRGFTKIHYQRLEQRCEGMEFAVEMVVKSSRSGARIAEVPVTLQRDGRTDHRGHLRTVRDGWRTLRYFAIEWRSWRQSKAVRVEADVNTPVQPQFDSYAGDYERALGLGLRYSGEDGAFFARGRVCALAVRLRELGVRPATVLDFGCGTGTTMSLLTDVLGAERAIGVDVSKQSLAIGRARNGHRGEFEFRLASSIPVAEADCAYCNGVFHHIAPAERSRAVAQVRSALLPGGLFALCENNPWNPGTRLVMRSIPFDRDAVPLTPRQARRLLEAGGFEVLTTDFLFIFPRALRMLRRFERRLARWPVGGQYMIVARRPAHLVGREP
jgi:SAM-dependent methyltransferase